MQTSLKKIFQPSPFKRALFFLLSDLFLLSLSLYLSFLIRFDFAVPREYLQNYFWPSLPLFLTLKITCLYFWGLYNLVWQYVSLREFVNILKALSVAELLLFILIKYILHGHTPLLGYPRSIFLIDLYLSVFAISGLRIAKRIYLEVMRRSPPRSAKRTLILGAGNTGEMVVRDLQKQHFRHYYPCGFLDDDPFKIGTYIHGIPVLGSTHQLKELVSKHDIEALIIATVNINYHRLREIYQQAREAGLKEIKIIPRIYSYTEPRVEGLRLEDISMEDLLKREEVQVEKDRIRDFIRGKRVLITGAGGSIGSELTRQIASFDPDRLILLEIDETELHHLMLQLQELYPDLFPRIHFLVGDITDPHRVNQIFRKFRPEIVFHAAAYKHVPMMEFNPEEAVRVNVLGTYNLARAAVENGTRKFILISTDKAVRPTSIMGATKRMAEHICRAFNTPETEFVAVRFGNVLGSRGSVLPIFLEQIKKGGPVTVTHKDMRRYFMTVSEAVSLVLQASVMGKGGEVMVLDMGKPIRILDLAEELIRLHGLEPYRDIKIEFVGPRPGEKIFEELLTAEEGTVATYHERVFVARNSEKFSREEIEKILQEFREVLKDPGENPLQTIRNVLQKYVRFFEKKEEGGA